ncbi:MAG TPA: ArsR family transcriptional regulator [Janthinobacterium sp.]|nr:ArsR family transcriptional regulator [Janthinobacterium sp.]
MNKSRNAALKSHYKLNPPAMGVYIIRNLATGKSLLALSNNLDGAINRQRFELKLGTHRNAALLADWKRHGEASFNFAILDTVAPSVDPAFDADAEMAALLALHADSLARPLPSCY